MLKAVLTFTAVASVAGFAPVAPARVSTANAAVMSKALPFIKAPKGLDGLLGAEAGFDPLGFAEMMDVKFMREAEIKHGRVSMLAILGFTYPEMPWAVQAFPGEAYSHANPIVAAASVPLGAFVQILFFVGVMEFGLNKEKMTMMDMFEDKARVPGDYGFDPLQLMSPANEERMKMRELQHCRVAMVGILGMIGTSLVSGHGVFGSST